MSIEFLTFMPHFDGIYGITRYGEVWFFNTQHNTWSKIAEQPKNENGARYR